MSADSEDYDVQPADETDFQTDPAYIAWEAREEGERDFANGIDILDGFRKLKARHAGDDEINAWAHGFNRGYLFKIASEAGVSPWQELSAVI